MRDMKNILFYKFVQLEALETFHQDHQNFCVQLGLLGKVLIASEGINGCVSGSDVAIKRYMDTMHADPRFSDMEFKIAETDGHTFKKMFVRIRKEIVSMHLDKDVDMKNKAPYIEPQEFKELLESDEEVVLVDVRNDYESKIGHFAGAVQPPMKTFKEWPELVAQMKDLKYKKIVTYCTGGIRCEKASAYMKEQGFDNVRQLHGGIIRYGKEIGNDHWEGKCFVFDRRGAVNIDPDTPQEAITQCELCSLPSDSYHNCALVSCDRRFIACESCLRVLENCCSKHCRNQGRTHPEKIVNA